MLIYKFDYIRNIVYNQAKDKQKHTDFPQIGFPNIRIFLASTHCKPSFPKQPAVCAHPFSRKQLSSAKKGNRPPVSCSHVSRWAVPFFHRAIARDRGKPNGFSRLPHCGAVARAPFSPPQTSPPSPRGAAKRPPPTILPPNAKNLSPSILKNFNIKIIINPTKTPQKGAPSKNEKIHGSKRFLRRRQNHHNDRPLQRNQFPRPKNKHHRQ